MSLSPSRPAPCITGLARLALLALLSLPLLSAAQMETGRWKTRTRQLPVFFPTPTAVSGSPELLVVPLLGPQRHLLPGGRLLVWVGRNDGTPLANASVTLRVPPDGNALVSDGNRVTEVTLQTNAEGIAEARFAAPDIPPGGANGGNNGGGEEDPPAT